MTNRERESLTGSSARLGRWVMSMKDLRVLRRPPYDAARVPPSAGEPADRVPVWASVCPHRVLRLLRVELDDQLLLHRGVDHLPGRQRVHQHAHLGGDDLQPRGDRPAASLGPGHHERRQLPAGRAHLDDVVLADPVRRDVDFLAVDQDVPVPDHLTGHVPGLGEAGPVDHVVQPRLEDAQQFVAGLALATVGLLVVATELLLQYAIDAGALLLLALLLEVLAVLGTAAAVPRTASTSSRSARSRSAPASMAYWRSSSVATTRRPTVARARPATNCCASSSRGWTTWSTGPASPSPGTWPVRWSGTGTSWSTARKSTSRRTGSARTTSSRCARPAGS